MLCFSDVISMDDVIILMHFLHLFFQASTKVPVFFLLIYNNVVKYQFEVTIFQITKLLSTNEKICKVNTL